MKPQATESQHIIKLGMPMSPGVWRNARIDIGTTLLFSLFNVVLNQFYLVFAIQQGATNIQVGILAAAPAIGLLLSPFWAVLVEKTDNPKPFVVYPNVIGRLLLIFPAFFPHPSVFVVTIIIFQILMGIQAPSLCTASISYVSE